MQRLFLRFDDESFDGFDWTIVDGDAAVSHLSWRKSVESDLKALLAQHSMPTVLVIPQQLVYLTEFELPEKASRQILASIGKPGTPTAQSSLRSSILLSSRSRLRKS